MRQISGAVVSTVGVGGSLRLLVATQRGLRPNQHKSWLRAGEDSGLWSQPAKAKSGLYHFPAVGSGSVCLIFLTCKNGDRNTHLRVVVSIH